MVILPALGGGGDARNYVVGEWREATGAGGQDVTDPGTDERLADVPLTNEAGARAPSSATCTRRART